MIKRARLIGFFTLILFTPLSARMELWSSEDDTSDELVLVGRVIGQQFPRFPWPMECGRLDYLYVKIERVVQGTLPSKFVGIAHCSNPGSDPDHVLPEAMFDGRTIWEFRLVRFESIGDHLDVNVSDDGEDWMGTPYADPENPEQELIPIHPKCFLVPGAEPDRLALEQASPLKLYWLDWDKYHQVKQSE